MATWNAGLETYSRTMDDIKFTQLSHKHSVDVHRVKYLCQTLYKYFTSNDSILITDYPLPLRACLLEYLIYKQIRSTNRKTIFLHISELVMEQIPTLDVKSSKLFGGVITHTPIDYSKKIFTIFVDDYSYLANRVIPTSPRDGSLYIYFGDDTFNCSQLPGFKDIQNLVMVDELLPSYSHQVFYPFIHFFDKQTNSKTNFWTDDVSKLTPIPDYLSIPPPDIPLLDMLINKYSLRKQTHIIEYLTSSVMNCIERGESMVVDGFSDMLLVCLLDYVIEKRLERAACLYTLVDCTNNSRKHLQKLEVTKTNNYITTKHTLSFSKEVIFSKFTQRLLNQPVPHNCILVSYTLNGCRFKTVTLFGGPFLSLMTNNVEKTLLSSSSRNRPYTRITYLSEINDVRNTYWNGIKFLTTKPVNSQSSPIKFEISENVFVPPAPEGPMSITDLTTDPVVDLITDPIALPITILITDTSTNPITVPITDTTTDTITDTTTDPITVPITHPITIPITDTTTDTIALPITDTTTDPITVPITDTTTDPITVPITDTTTDTITDTTTDPITVPITHPITIPITDTTTDPITVPITDTTTDPITVPITDTTTDPITVPITDTTTDPITDTTTHPIIDHKTISALSPTRKADHLDRLIDDHNIQQHSHIIHSLSSSVVDYMERGESVAVGGFDMSTLICLLDYIIIERVWENTGLSIVVDSIKKHRKSFAILDITKMEDFEILKSSVETSNKVVFTQLNREVIDSINTHSKDFIVISLSTFGYNFQILNLLNCPFISLSCSNLSERLLSKVSKPFTLITQELDEFRYMPRNELKEGRTPESNTLPHPSNNTEYVESIPNEPYSPFNIKYLLERLTMKYNCNLDIKICYTLYELLDNGESVIVDFFSRPQLLFIIDFIFAIKTYQKVSVIETKTLIFCQLKWLDSVFKDLDVVRSNQHTILMSDGSFDRNRKVLVLKKLERNFLERLNQNLMIDSSYLLVRLAKKRNAKFVNVFNQLNSSFLGLSEGKVASFPNKPFIHLRGNGLGGFELNVPTEDTPNNERGEVSHSGAFKVKEDNNDIPQVNSSITPVKFEIEDDKELLDSVSTLSDTPLDIYPLFLNKQNPITTHIYELLNKFVIELLYTDLPTDLYVTTFTYLIEYRNVCVDGFPFRQLTPLLTVYALECQELGIPVSIHYGNNTTKLPTDKLENIPEILNTDLIRTLSDNVDIRHIWIFIGIDYTLLTQVIPLVRRTHQVILLLSNTVSGVFERSSLAVTRIYKFLDCVFVRSFNQHLLRECIYDTSLGKFDTETSTNTLQTESDRFVDIEPNHATVTSELVDNPHERMQATSTYQELTFSTQTAETSTSLKSDTNEVVNISLAEFKFAEINGEICKPDLIETKSESEEEFMNLSRNHTPSIPYTDNVLECNNTADLDLPSEWIKANSDCVETDILSSDEREEILVITETEANSFLPEYTQNSNNINSTDIFHHPMDSKSPKLETYDMKSTEPTAELIAESQQQVIIPENTIIDTNSCHPTELGTQLVTSPLRHGMNTILYSTDSTFYNQLILRLAEVLDYTHPSLQVVVTSQNPDICSKLLKLVSSRLNSYTRGFLYKFGPINSLREYIIQNKVQILSLPVTPLVDLIQSDNCLFIGNKILVYVDDSSVSRLENHNLEILTDEIADQYILILPDKRTFSSFPSPYCQIEVSASANNESYLVEFSFQD